MCRSTGVSHSRKIPGNTGQFGPSVPKMCPHSHVTLIEHAPRVRAWTCPELSDFRQTSTSFPRVRDTRTSIHHRVLKTRARRRSAGARKYPAGYGPHPCPVCCHEALSPRRHKTTIHPAQPVTFRHPEERPDCRRRGRGQGGNPPKNIDPGHDETRATSMCSR